MESENTILLNRYAAELDELRTLYAAGNDPDVFEKCDKLLADLEVSRLDKTLVYADVMRLAGQAGLKRGDFVMANGALSIAYNLRVELLSCDDRESADILVELAEVLLLRNMPEQAAGILAQRAKI